MITPLHFNPRSREGSDGSNPDAFQQRILFQSTLPRRERLELSSPTLLDTKSISIHAPAKGATDYFFIQLAQSKISIHAPAKGATSERGVGSRYPEISIHAPAKGATASEVVLTFDNEFQSTLPRRERPCTFSASTHQPPISIHAPAKGATAIYQLDFVQLPDFNPRSREGSDAIALSAASGVSDFNPRSREGSDRQYSNAVYFSSRFQSTLPRRERLIPVIIERRLDVISIHAPAKGATYIDRVDTLHPRISIHAPAKGATTQGWQESARRGISIHAPAKGATCVSIHNTMSRQKFQSTLPRRERLQRAYRCTAIRHISIHAPAKGATFALFGTTDIDDISIHAPAKGATGGRTPCQKCAS